MSAMIIDFHTHSNASDGSLSPLALISQAIEAGIEYMAITDHDCIDGYLLAVKESDSWPEGFQLLPGVELSCLWGNGGVHVVGLNVDVENLRFLEGLAFLAQSRNKRAAAIAGRLEGQGFAGSLAGARAKAGASQIGRPHFAAWMLEQGHVKDMNEAFGKYLGAGKIGDVKTFWPSLVDVVSWITGAGGVAILAHPLKYKYTRSKLRRLVKDFKAAGGGAIEIFSGRQTEDRTRQLRLIVDEFDLLASAGSDFHGHREYGPRLGVDVAQFGSVASVWGHG